MTRKQAATLHILKAEENKALATYSRGLSSIHLAIRIFGKDELYDAWMQAAMKTDKFMMEAILD